MSNRPTANNQRSSPPPTTIDATPRGYAIDVRVFLAIITTTMAVAFSAGVMIGPSDPALVTPVLNLLGIVPLMPAGMSEMDYLKEMQSGSMVDVSVASPAGKLSVDAPSLVGGANSMFPSSTSGSVTSKKAKENVVMGEVSANGNVKIVDDTNDDDNDNDEDEDNQVLIKQPRRTSTKHVATLGYKIRETHVNIDTPVLEGTADIPYERDIHYNRNNNHSDSSSSTTSPDNMNDLKQENLRDQSMPSGQHLLVDIKNVQAAFLNSESRLAEAMLGSVAAAGLTMLSYHCHSLHPAGVSCVGVLLESHISFHTWPDEGVITLDMFTTSDKPLLPVLPEIERLFGVPRAKNGSTTGELEEIVTVWSHELRGFRTEDERKRHVLDDNSDLSNWVTSPLEVTKKHIVTVQTEFQQIDIWDVKEREDTPSYEDGLRLGMKPGDPRWFSNEVASPQRLLFLDGVLQTISDAEREYHESLVHPAMFAHPSPKNVAIIGGGEGATLREVLKHRTVEHVTMIEKDERIVDVAREYLPAMSDCSDIVGSASSCFEDGRATLVFQNANDYFVVKEGEKNQAKEIDVLIVDGTIPETEREVPDHWFNDGDFVNALVDSLSEQGVIATQVGTAPSILDPRADMGVFRHRERFINFLEANPKINSIFVYEEAHCGFHEPKSFLVACRDVSCRKHWYAETDEVDYQIYERIGGTVSEKPSLVHFDGATQRSFQAPPRAWETVYCRREPEPFECAYVGLDMDAALFEFDPEDDNASAFEIRSTKNEATGLDESAVYAKVDMPEGSYIMPSHLAASFEVSDDSMENIRATTQIEGVDKATVIEDFIEFIDAHGHKSLQIGSGKNFVEVGGSFIMRTSESANEANVRRWIPPHPEGDRPKFSPVYDRHRHSFDVFLVASRDIKAGEEVVKPVGLWSV